MVKSTTTTVATMSHIPTVFSPYYSPGLGYGVGQIFPNGDCSFSIGIYYDSYGKSPYTWFGSMNNIVAFYVFLDGDVDTSGDVYIDTSYGKSSNSHHTNETINAFRISSSGDIDDRNWIFTTGSYGFIRINLSGITEK